MDLIQSHTFKMLQLAIQIFGYFINGLILLPCKFDIKKSDWLFSISLGAVEPQRTEQYLHERKNMVKWTLGKRGLTEESPLKVISPSLSWP